MGDGRGLQGRVQDGPGPRGTAGDGILLCIPSCYSSKLLLTDRRNCPGDDVIEASECLKSWADSGIVYGCVNSDVNRMESTLKALELYSLGLRFVVMRSRDKKDGRSQ